MRSNPKINGRNISTATLLMVALLQSCPSIAAGALAVGLPADVAHQGFAAGHSVNAADMDMAQQRALDSCQRSVGGSDVAKQLCKVVATFSEQCYALAIDPKANTPGVGWAIADSLQMADAQAIDACRTRAGRARRDFCAVLSSDEDHGCDGNAK